MVNNKSQSAAYNGESVKLFLLTTTLAFAALTAFALAFVFILIVISHDR